MGNSTTSITTIAARTIFTISAAIPRNGLIALMARINPVMIQRSAALSAIVLYPGYTLLRIVILKRVEMSPRNADRMARRPRTKVRSRNNGLYAESSLLSAAGY